MREQRDFRRNPEIAHQLDAGARGLDDLFHARVGRQERIGEKQRSARQ